MVWRKDKEMGNLLLFIHTFGGGGRDIIWEIDQGEINFSFKYIPLVKGRAALPLQDPQCQQGPLHTGVDFSVNDFFKEKIRL